MAVVTTNLEVWYDSTNSASNTGSGTTLYDLSGNARNGTINNPTRVQNYFETTTTATNISLDTGVIFDSFMSGASCQFSVEMWMWIEQTATVETGRYRPFFSSMNSAVTAGFIGMSERPSAAGGVQTAFGWYFIDPFAVNLQNGLSFGAWFQYVFVNDGITRRLYENGVLKTSATYSSAAISASSTTFKFIPQIENYYGWEGKFAIGRVYSKVLTAGEVLQNYEADKFNINKITNFDFSNTTTYSGSGSTVYDLTSFKNNGVISGATFGGSGTSKYFEFTGLNDSIYSGIGLSPNTANTVWTENIWFKAGSGNSDSVISSYGNSTGTLPRLVVSNSSINSGNLSFSNRTGSDTLDLGVNPVLDQWYNVILVGTGFSVLGFLDGVYKGASSNSEFPGTPKTFTLSGTNNGTQAPISGFFNGSIGLFEFYNTPLLGTSAVNLYDSQKLRFNPPPPPGLITEFDFSDTNTYSGSGSTVYDISGYGNYGLITGATFAGSGTSKYFEFTGANDNIYSPVALLPNITNTVWTENIWFQAEPGSDKIIYCYGTVPPTSISGTTILAYGFSGIYSGRAFYEAGSAADRIDLGFTPASGTWYNVVLTGSGTTVSAYLNDSLVGTVAQTENILAPKYMNLSGLSNGTSAPSGYMFNGKIAIFRVYDYAQTTGEISAQFAIDDPRFNPAPPPPPPYVGQVGGRTFGQGFAG